MTFMVSLITLLIERFFDWSHLRQWHWFLAYQRAFLERLTGQSPYLVLILTLLPLLVGVGVINFALQNVLFGFIKLAFQLVVVLYCLGPKNLWADSFASINAFTQGDAHNAADKLKAAFGINEVPSSQEAHRLFLNAIFIAANRRVFGVIFWYVVLGPVGAVLYRTISLSVTEGAKVEALAILSAPARLFETLLDWVPVRIFTFLFALGGQFVQVLTCWRKKVLLGLDGNEILLEECGQAAVGIVEGKIPEAVAPETAAISLLDRVFIIVLVLIAIFVWVI